MTDVHANYLRDLGRLLRDRCEEERRSTELGSDRQFDAGLYRAYREVLALMLSQAEVFDIPPSDLSLDGLDREMDLGC
jgi:hypothetical protein